MSIIVYWIQAPLTKGDIFQSLESVGVLAFSDSELSAALAVCEEKRKEGCSHVTISSELSGSVGRPGVTAIESGKTPDGVQYEWSKQHRGDGPVTKV